MAKKRPSRRTRKTVWVMVKLSVPVTMSAAAARLEARTLINDACTYYADPGDVKARAVQPAPRPDRRPWVS